MKLVKSYFFLTLVFIAISCTKGEDDELNPNGDFVKFKVDGKEVSQENVKGQWDLTSRFYGDEAFGYRFQLELSAASGEAPKFWFEFHSKEKFVANKDYNSTDPNGVDTYSVADFTVPTDDVIIKTKNFKVNNGITIVLTTITEDRVAGKFTLNANHIKDATKPSITEGEFSAKRRDL